MNSRLRKAIIIPVLAICVMVIFMLSVTATLRAERHSAQAAVADLEFTVEAGIYDADTGTWMAYLDGTSYEHISFRFLLTSPNKNPSITQFNYVEGTSDAAVRASMYWKEHGECN